jgi:hypothetical protein
MEMNWAILKYETGRHALMPTSLCRLGIPCILPLIENYHIQAKRNVSNPALTGILFMPADEKEVRTVIERVRYAESVWRDSQGHLIQISDKDVQMFLDSLNKNERKAKTSKVKINLADAADKVWFDLCHNLFGLSKAIKQFGKDLRDAT